ncbi:MAG: dihydroneopterin aldolase [Burkholderiales bacterium]|nr:dihydroneopterin aldolase [Burkholderiales bacterium]
MDIIFLRDWRIELSIGIYPWERRMPQTIELELDIGLPGSRAGQTDRIEDTLDYGAIVGRIEESLKGRRFDLLEALAEHIAHIVRHEFGAPWVRVTVTKLCMLRNIRRVGLTIERGERI